MTDKEVTRLKKVILSDGNELVDLIGSNFVILRVVMFKEMN